MGKSVGPDGFKGQRRSVQTNLQNATSASRQTISWRGRRIRNTDLSAAKGSRSWSTMTRLLQKDDCFILNLPNELVCNILSYALPYESEKFDTWDRRLASSPFHSIRAVCRRFRATVAELPFWWIPSFNILSFRPYAVEHVRFLNDLFTDPGIVETLARRTHWDGLGIETLDAIANGVPSFRENVKSVSILLEDMRPMTTHSHSLTLSPFDIAIIHLAICPNPVFRIADYVRTDIADRPCWTMLLSSPSPP